MSETKQFDSLTEYYNFILNSPQEIVEEHLFSIMGKDKFNEYKKLLKEYEDTLIHGTGTTQPMGILNFKDSVK